MIKIKILHKPSHEIMTVYYAGSLGAARCKAREWCAEYFGGGEFEIDYILPREVA